MDVDRFVLDSLPPAPARVLEVGAGDGSLARAIRQAGYDVVAIDPAWEADDIRPVALADLDEPRGSFDAAVAVVSLHHVRPLEASCRHLAELIRPGGTLVVDEFDVSRLDTATVSWWLAQQPGSAPEHGHGDRDPAAIIAEMHAHLHGFATVASALEPWFDLDEPVRGPYLYRWNLPPGLRSTEEDLIAAGALPATGVRVAGRRRAPA